MYFIDIFIKPIANNTNKKIRRETTESAQWRLIHKYEEDNTAATTTPIVWLILWLDFVYVLKFTRVFIFSAVSVEHH